MIAASWHSLVSASCSVDDISSRQPVWPYVSNGATDDAVLVSLRIFSRTAVPGTTLVPYMLMWVDGMGVLMRMWWYTYPERTYDIYPEQILYTYNSQYWSIHFTLIQVIPIHGSWSIMVRQGPSKWSISIVIHLGPFWLIVHCGPGKVWKYITHQFCFPTLIVTLATWWWAGHLKQSGELSLKNAALKVYQLLFFASFILKENLMS